MKNFKNVFLLVGIFAFTLALVGSISTNKAYAAVCTAEASGDWNNVTTWDAACHGDATFPTAADSVIIPSGFIVNVNVASAATTVTINNAGAPTGLTFTGGITLTVGGAVTLNAPSVDGTTTVAIGAGTLAANSLAIAGGTGSKISEVTLAPSGSLSVTTTVTLSGTAANARLTTSGAGAKTISIGTNLVNGGTITFGGGTLTSTVTGTTTISSGATLTASDATGTYTYGGLFTVNSGGIYNETVPGTATTFGAGNIANAGTMTINTGTHTFSGTITNTGTFNYANGATLTANTQLVASTSGTINYTGAAQTVTLVDYYNLGLSGSGVKVVGAATVLNALAISGTAQASMTGDATANSLTLGGVTGLAGTWGSTSSVATYTNDTYFAGTNLVTVATGSPTLPTVAVTLSDYAVDIGETAIVTFTFSTAPTGFTSADVTVANGTIGAIDASVPTVQTATFTPTADVTDLINVITVGTGWTDGTNPPAGSTNSANYEVTTVSGGGGSGGGSRVHPSTPPVTPGNSDVSCPPGHMFSTVTGAKCTSSTGLVFCPPGQAFNTNTGQRCNSISNSSAPGASGYTFGSATVKQGTKGEACRAWQMFFNDKAGAKLATDGNCGPLTMAAAKAWQSSKGLKADGLLGPMSRAKAMMQ